MHNVRYDEKGRVTSYTNKEEDDEFDRVYLEKKKPKPKKKSKSSKKEEVEEL